MKVKEEDILKFQKDIWDVVSPHTTETEEVLMAAANMMKISLSLYTVILNDDEIEHLLEHQIMDSIPKVRSDMQKQLTRTVH
tara:strand:- start:12081 stop:12326 length:246 start_codon:yes stop_codon:yes gene_type:complete